MSSEFLQRVTYFLMFIPILTFHEAAHAWVAHRLGDDTARNQGRLTLNPLVHIDPIGTLLIPAINLFTSSFGLIGWGKPVPIDSSQFRSWRRDEVLVALAGPLSNLILATFVLFCCRWLPAGDGLRDVGVQFAFLSCFLAVFNLIPIPPLDGWYPLKHAFRVPEEFVYRGGIWWFIILLVLINLPPVMFAMVRATEFIVGLLAFLTQFRPAM